MCATLTYFYICGVFLLTYNSEQVTIQFVSSKREMASMKC